MPRPSWGQTSLFRSVDAARAQMLCWAVPQPRCLVAEGHRRGAANGRRRCIGPAHCRPMRPATGAAAAGQPKEFISPAPWLVSHRALSVTTKSTRKITAGAIVWRRSHRHSRPSARSQVHPRSGNDRDASSLDSGQMLVVASHGTIPPAAMSSRDRHFAHPDLAIGSAHYSCRRC